MAFDENLARRIRSYFDDTSVLFEEKRMMGGLCFLVNGKMCVGVEKDRLMARLDPEMYEAALAREGCVPMDFTGRPMRGFVFVISSALGSRRRLQQWLDLALEFNPRARVSKKRVGKHAATVPQTSRPRRGKQLNTLKGKSS